VKSWWACGESMRINGAPLGSVTVMRQ